MNELWNEGSPYRFCIDERTDNTDLRWVADDVLSGKCELYIPRVYLKDYRQHSGGEEIFDEKYPRQRVYKVQNVVLIAYEANNIWDSIRFNANCSVKAVAEVLQGIAKIAKDGKDMSPRTSR